MRSRILSSCTRLQARRLWAREASSAGKPGQVSSQQGVREELKPQGPSSPKEVPEPTHPNRNMEVNASIPNEETAEHVPDQVPEKPTGGRYPDPLNDRRGQEMTGSTKEASKAQGGRPGSGLLSEDKS